MPFVLDPRDTQSALVGPVRSDLLTPDRAPDAPRPPILDIAAAASRQATLPGGAYDALMNADPFADFDPSYDALDDIAGYEEQAHRFVDAHTRSQVQGIKARIGQEQRDQETLDHAGLGGPLATIGLNLLDPSFLAAAAVPELALAKGVRMRRVLNAAVQGAVGASAYEVGMHALHPDRTLTESAINIGAGALLSGLLGSLGRRMPREEVDALREAVQRELVPPNLRSEVGAAYAGARTTLEQETIARGGQTLDALAGRVPLMRTDLQIVLNAESVDARRALGELADVTPILQKNVEGIASATPVELLVGRHEGRVADFVDHLRDAWIRYRGRVPRAERMRESQFRAAVSSAARQSDRSIEPEIAEAAKYLRARVFDPLKAQAQELGLLPADVEVVGAESYFRRMYDREAIRANRREWDSVLTSHFLRRGASSYAEARSIAEDITRRILGADVGVANFNVRTHLPNAGPLHERVLDIRDELLEPWLVNDPVKVASAYVRELAPQIEVTKRFGDKDMAAEFQRISDQYDVLRENIRGGLPREVTTPELTRLSDQQQQVLEALRRVRDRVYGRAGSLGPGSTSGQRRAAEVLRGWRNLVAASKLGTTALISAPLDTMRAAATYGFVPTMAKIAKLATSADFRALSKEQARRLGAAVEVALARRVVVAYDGAATEGWTQALANGVYKYTGLNHWTDFGRTLSVTLLEDEILKAAHNVARGVELPTWTRTRLASLGLDASDLNALNQQAAKYGGEVDGVRVSGSANWDDVELAARYEAALLKEARTIVMQPGAANRTWWQDSELGRVLGQLKAFSISAPMRMGITPAQMIGQGHPLLAARFVGYMMIGGALSHILRATAAGYAFETDPAKLAGEAFTEAGLGGVMPDLASLAARRFGLFGESARYSDRNVASALAGPAVGTFQDAIDLVYNRSANGVSAADLHLLRRLLPYQNVFWARRAINALEGETAEALDLAGAETHTFGERFTETKPLLPTAQRGGTGTGQVVY